MSPITFQPIGRIRSCFSEKFGIPRQPGLVSEATAALELYPPFHDPEAFRGLQDFSHIWILFFFHACAHKAWRPTVRPPRLGGNRRMGIFATRSGFRPNPIGQSVVELTGIEARRELFVLHLKGIDLLDGTPVLDIKPYLPYAECLSQARAGYAQQPPEATPTVTFSNEALKSCHKLEERRYGRLRELISALLAQDPRPAYRGSDGSAEFGMRLWDLNVRFKTQAQNFEVISVERCPADEPTSRVHSDGAQEMR
jgi:tRNA (adenine37-N6)-methyltransferase